jgi:hypothetical protein
MSKKGALLSKWLFARVETKIFVFGSRKFIFAFREKSLPKVTKITKIFAKTKMYEKTDAGNRKYCEIS